AGDQDGGPDPDLLLAAARAAARRSRGDGTAGGPGRPADFGDAEAGEVQAARDGAARDPVPGVGPAGREFQAWPAAAGRGRSLGVLARLGAILAIAIASALAFGAVLAGLRALQDLA